MLQNWVECVKGKTPCSGSAGACHYKLEDQHGAKGLLQRFALWKLWPPAAGQRHGPPCLAGQLPAARRLQVACCIRRR